ncbi:MAG TPA: DUF3859 domain-containing protein [Nitrospinota bacterium]|nr:DUF3859 domain-containing protein [Nitrospinota bacterium]
MRIIGISLLVCLLSFPIAACAEEVEVYGIDIVEYGEYRSIVAGKGGAEDTSLGYINILQEIELIKKTTTINGIIGNLFGLRYKVKGQPSGKKVILTVKIIHPETKNPETQQITSIDQWRTTTNIGDITYTGWRFEFDWEIVPGKWTIGLWHEGRKLIEKTFTVYKPINV